uniref:C-type lectin domain-containing protein n=1 Tax=Cyprinodon variegatus TaxID=28743 RepID=A0A3Q2CV70_CYPVA
LCSVMNLNICCLACLLEKQFPKVCPSLYYISSTTNTWNDSRKDCLERGADLAIIDSKEEQDFLRKFQKRLWIGLTDADVEGEWKWVDGSLLNIRLVNCGSTALKNIFAESVLRIIIAFQIRIAYYCTKNSLHMHCENTGSMV